MRRSRVWLLAGLLALAGGVPAVAQEAEPEETAAPEAESGEELPEQVKALKEKVLESKARLLMLPEEIHGSSPSEAAIKFVVANKLSNDYRLTAVEAKLDGEPLMKREIDDDASAADRASFEYEGPIAPGAHRVDLVLHYTGHGYGLFPYMKAYKIQVTSDYTFVVPDSVVAAVTATIYGENPLTEEWKDRPRVRFDVDETKLLPRTRGAPPTPPGHSPQDPENQ